MGCIDAAMRIAVEECIDSRMLSVKKKTTMEWKKWQQFFMDEARVPQRN
jgi:6-phosphogluconolactonase/glucosamine-6-phosphate isomerase/deaminase